MVAAAPTLPAEQAIAEAAARYRNWGRWGPDDVLGTVNFIDDAKRREAAGLVRRGVPCLFRSRSTPNGPQHGLAAAHQPGAHHDGHRHRRRALGKQGFPHGHRRR